MIYDGDRLRDHIISSKFISKRNQFNLAPTTTPSSSKLNYNEPHPFVYMYALFHKHAHVDSRTSLPSPWVRANR